MLSSEPESTSGFTAPEPEAAPPMTSDADEPMAAIAGLLVVAGILPRPPRALLAAG